MSEVSFFDGGFVAVPNRLRSYVKGRASIERINDVVRSINKIIAQHAAIMAVPISKMEPSQLQRYRAIKLLYSENTKGQDGTHV